MTIPLLQYLPEARDELLDRLQNAQRVGLATNVDGAGFDPAAAASWATSIADPGMRVRAVGSVARTWASSSPAQAAAWIGNLNDPGARNSATEVYSSTLARTDPSTAAQWATTISDAGARDRAVANVVRRWRRADAPAANAFVQTSPALPPELKQRLLR
ncbi:MAG: hypothetical protein WEB31_03045 [Chthoniobacterales bacterium]